jgi:hypothetical protein
MNMMKRFFSNNYVLIIACVLLLGLLVGAAALLIPAANLAVGSSDCKHVRYRSNGFITDEDGVTIYSFICADCRAVIRETPSSSSFVLNKPTMVDEKVVMRAPWEAGAYYGETYRLFTKKTNKWLTDGELWADATGVRVDDYRVKMIAVDYGAGALSYIAEKEGYVHPYFDLFKYSIDGGSCEFAILVNGKRVLPEGGNIVLESMPAGTDVTETVNEMLADQWIHVNKGDRVSFVIYGASVYGYEFTVSPVVEIMTYSPTR